MSNPAPPPIAYQAHVLTEADRTHLNVLAVCYWVWGGLIALSSLLGFIYVAMGIAFLGGAFSNATTQNSAPPAAIGWVFIVLGFAAVVLGQLVGWLNVLVGFSLKRDRRWLLCNIMAGINCLSVPLGTVLGIFTFIVLARPGVKAAFAANSPAGR